MMACLDLLINHNITARASLLDSIEKLDQDVFLRDLGVGRLSLRNILVHLMDAEKYWISVVKGAEIEHFNPEIFPTLDAVRRAWCDVERETRDYLDTLDDDQLQHVKSIVWNNDTINFTIGKALVHFATHEIHHRGVIIGLLRQLGLEPPDVSML